MKRTHFLLLLLATMWVPLFFCVPACAQEADSTSVPADTLGSVQLGEATARGTRLMFVMKKDTVVYDLDALLAGKGEMLGEVLDRFPGLELRDGCLYFKGRAVNRLLVNGTDFVRGDATRALEQLPAYVVKNVKAYEGQTDQSKVTGIDDGVREQVVDIILRKEYMGTWTGNADLGYGTDDYWRVRAFANTFTNRFRFSAFAGLTNTGQFQSVANNGDWGENGGAGASAGKTAYKQPGFSFMWKNKKADNEAGYFKIDGSASWDYRGHHDFFRNTRETFLDNGSEFSAADTRRYNREQIWGTSLYFTWKPARRTHIEYNPHFNITLVDDRSHGRSGAWNVDAAALAPAPLDSLMAATAGGWPEGEAVNLTQQESGASSKAYGYSHYLWATQQLSDNNWRLTLRSSVGTNYRHQQGNTLTRYTYFQDLPNEMPELLNRYKDGRATSYSQLTFIDLNIPLRFFQTLRFTYGNTSSRSHNDDKGYRLDALGGVFGSFYDYLDYFGLLPSEPDWEMMARDLDISINAITTGRKHWAEAYLQYKDKHFYASLQNCYRRAHDEIYYHKGDLDPVWLDRDDSEYVLHTQLRYETDSLGNCDLKYYYEISPTAIGNLITIPSTSDPLNITVGNANLKFQRYHSLNLKYDRTFRRSRFLSLDAGWSVTINRTTMRSTYNRLTGVTVSQPVNISGLWDASARVHYSMPLDSRQRWQLSTNANYGFWNTPTYGVATAGDPVRRSDKVHRVNAGLDLSVNISSRFYARLGGNMGYYDTRSTLASSNAVSMWSNSYDAQAQYKIPAIDFLLKTTVRVNHYIGATAQAFHPVRTIWNALVEKAMLRDKSLAVQVELSDILNQRDQSGAWASTSARGTWYGLTVGRFVMLHVVYRFSTKKG